MIFSLNKSAGIALYDRVLKARLKYIEKELIFTIYDKLYINTPKRTGRLANGYIVHDTDRYMSISNNVPYLDYVNYGTIYQKPQYFIQISIQQGKDKLPYIISESRKINNV